MPTRKTLQKPKEADSAHLWYVSSIHLMYACQDVIVKVTAFLISFQV